MAGQPVLIEVLGERNGQKPVAANCVSSGR
jgi:hypothetical protein